MSPVKPLLAAAFLAVAAQKVHAEPKILYSEPHEGTYIIRDYLLSQAFIYSDKACTLYSDKQAHADEVSRNLKYATKKRELREKAAAIAEARRWLGECLASDKAAKSQLREVLGATAIARLEKAAAFEDMVFIELEPTDGEAYVDIFERSKTAQQVH